MTSTKETKKEIKIKEALTVLNELSKLLDERIVDLHNVQGGMQSRHAYIFYRSKVWEAERLLGKYSI